ncbi:LysR family transcriptional regulator [Lactobacillus amylovorus]|uniref:LysR family transcriptional regulator n=1 Tax=Lactobacillus amylovorus TaxID=1604 RepID=UPI00313C600A|nr:LysR family transcriptional regulator [Lactobacillus amylovorus]
MNLRHLHFFVTLAQTQHMAKAAELLNISQPSLSYAINSLEQELGIPLFEKDGRNIKLTNYGKIYLDYVQKSLNILKEGSKYINELSDVNNGHINLGFTFTMGQDLVPHVVHDFLKNSQRKNITFSFKQGTTKELVQDLIDERLDLVFASNPSIKRQENQINIHHIVNQEIMAAVPLDHPLAKEKSVTLAELTKYPLISYAKDSGLRPNIDQIFKQENITPHIKLESMEDHTIIGFVHWGYGVAIIPNLPQLASNQVKLLHLDVQQNWHPLYAITKTNHYLAPSAKIFLDFTEDFCQKNYLNKNKLI